MRLLPFVLAGTFAFAAGAGAAEWIERPYDPPAGSRWIIQSDETTEDNRDGHVQTSVVKMTSELTVEQKIADGFRVTYVVRTVVYQGDAATAALMGPVTRALENLVVHATTGQNGMPLRLENLDEILAAARTAVDRLAAPWAGKPQVAALVRQLATGMLIADEKRAPKIYLPEVPILALGQNTGLRLGETRRYADEVANPLGGAPIKSDMTLRIDRADPASGDVRLIRTRAFDPDAIKEFAGKLAKRVGGDDAGKLEEVVKTLTLTFDSRAEIDVEQGMTRAVRQEETTTVDVPGHRMIKHARKLVTVTPAP